MIEYVTLEQVDQLLEGLIANPGIRQAVRDKFIKRTFKAVGACPRTERHWGAFTQTVFEGKDVKENDWLYVEVKNGTY